MALSNRNNLGGGGGVSPSGEHVEIATDGAKNFSQLYNELYALVDALKLSDRAFLTYEDATTRFISPLVRREATVYSFVRSLVGGSNVGVQSVSLMQTGSTLLEASITASTVVVNNQSSAVPPVGFKIRVYY